MYLLANFVFEFFQPFDGLVLDLLNPFRLYFFNSFGNPAALDQIKQHDAADQDSEKNLADVTKISNQSHDGARKEVADAAKNKNPQKTTTQRQRHKSDVRHAGHPIESARRP